MLTALLSYVIAFVWLLLNGNIQTVNHYIFQALTVVFALALIGYGFQPLNHTRRELARDQRTLNRLVDLLRGIETLLANGATLSFVEQATFRIRVARFDIGPEQDGVHRPVAPKPVLPLEPQPVSLHDAREAEQPSHS